jgi:hypothetical protein
MSNTNTKPGAPYDNIFDLSLYETSKVKRVVYRIKVEEKDMSKPSITEKEN